jgi:hypothetical protein
MIPDEIVILGLGVVAILAGLAVVALGVGLAVVPPTIPIFSAATEIASPIYLIIGTAFLVIGFGAMYAALSELLDGVGSGVGGKTRR